MPPMPVRTLMNLDFNAGIGHGTAEIIIRLDCDLHLLAESKRLLAMSDYSVAVRRVLFRRLHSHLELRQLVFLQAKESGGADHVLARRIPELNLVFTERHFVGELKRTGRAAEGV